MKIGILTLPLHTNYGGILQAFALQTYLNRQGHDVVVLDKEKAPNIRPWYLRPFLWSYHFVQKYFMHQNVEIFTENTLRRTYKEYLETSKYTQKFIETYIKTRVYRNLSDLHEQEFDAIVVGSDQVWRSKYQFGANMKDAFLNFTKGWRIKRISYAASFGVDEWEFSNKQTQECKESIKYFNAVSVREDSGVELCKQYLDYDAVHVLDPTMLLYKEDYIRLIEESCTQELMGDLLVYLIDETEEKKKILEKVSHRFSLTPFCVNSKVEDSSANIKERIQPPVEQWLRGFRDAKFIVTDSFHACVFSILFNKPFVVIGNKSRGLGRIYSLLNQFGLLHHLVLSADEWNPSENYTIPSNVYGKLNELRSLSKQFINSNL